MLRLRQWFAPLDHNFFPRTKLSGPHYGYLFGPQLLAHFGPSCKCLLGLHMVFRLTFWTFSALFRLQIILWVRACSLRFRLELVGLFHKILYCILTSFYAAKPCSRDCFSFFLFLFFNFLTCFFLQKLIYDGPLRPKSISLFYYFYSM